MNLSYSQYDASGNIMAISNVLDPTKNKSFTYDSLDRLATATGSWGSLGWTYDGVGNRQTQTNGGTSTYAYQTGTNKLAGITGTGSSPFTFDANGNTATENARQYTYNQNQRLIQVVDGAMTAGYTYNGNGQRVKKVVNGQTTVFHYSLAGQLVAESSSTGSVIAEYVYINSQPLAKIEGTNTYFYATDHLGTPQKLTDSTGAVVWSADYKPFGEVAVDPASTITNNLRFPGQYFDAETGLYQNWHRDYNLMLGKYIESDPIGIKGGINLYSYTANNPINREDPMGLMGSKGDSGTSSATSKLMGEIPAEILEKLIDHTIGSIMGAACANKYCKNHSTPSDWMKAYSTCLSIFAAHPEIPTGIPPSTTSDGFVSACASECMSITGKASFKDFCKICKK